MANNRCGVICINKNNNCSVVAKGNYNGLSDILEEVKNNYAENEIRLIEIDEDEFLSIKDDAVKINEKFKPYFEETSFSASLNKEVY